MWILGVERAREGGQDAGDREAPSGSQGETRTWRVAL